MNAEIPFLIHRNGYFYKFEKTHVVAMSNYHDSRPLSGGGEVVAKLK